MKTLARLAAAFMLLALDWLTGASRHEPVRYGPLVRLVTKHPWMTASAIVAALGIGAASVVVSGVVPVRASSGHWPVTAWLLDFAKLQSVRTYSLRIDTPRLDDEALIVRGAAHYAIGCASCHGSPEGPVPPVMNAMTPPPPELSGERLTRWTPAQLFSIVKHGIKFTGMPAWPGQQRDDEVWSMVAFLTRLPHIDRSEYLRLTGQERAIGGAVGTSGTDGTPAPISTLCARCHGADGTGRDGAFPSLAAQRADYLHAALLAFADRSRHSATMSEVAARLSDSEMRSLALYYQQLPGRAPSAAADTAVLTRGAQIATQGVAERDVPACAECHGPSDIPRNPLYPRLASQHASYLVQQLTLLQRRHRGGSPRVNLMHAFVDRIGPEEIRDVARYYASLSSDAMP
jgi:cytochrome c553